MSAKGAKSNSLGQRPREMTNAQKRKRWKREISGATVAAETWMFIPRFQRSPISVAPIPGPLAQAVTFRAFGATSVITPNSWALRP